MNARQIISTLVLAATSAAALTACGSSNKANTIATTPVTTPSAPATTSTAATIPTTTQTAPPTPTTPQATRTAPAPAFVGPRPQPGTELATAVAAATRAGYSVRDTSTYKTGQTLRVLIGSRGGVLHAFFFVNERYIGTDSATPSESLSVAAQNDTAVTLRYGIYRSGEQSPSSSKSVQFVLNNGKLTPLEPIPPVTGPSGGRR
jgi:LppP/LprE lipoprotein